VALTGQAPASTRALRDPGSYRDPSGFVYYHDGVVYRQINQSFGDRWDDLVGSGFLADLQSRGVLIGHEAALLEEAAEPALAHAVIRPEAVPTISYPYEWSFGMLKDAALMTLEAQVAASEAGFTLRDATAYNVQFVRGRPMLIDTLSFERAEHGAPWIAYRQFCEQFLAPLALMALRDVRLGLMLREHVDGIPLDLAARLLPGRTRWNLGLGAHVHAHARAQRRYAGKADEAAAETKKATISPMRQQALLDSLRRTIQKLDWAPEGTEWVDYADNTSYGETGTAAKEDLVKRLLAEAGGDRVWDLGANTGRYSRIAAGLGRDVVAWDIDPAAVERNYRQVRRDGEERILPLVLDLANPSPGLGWADEERRSVAARANADTLLALALVHHLAIGRNVPLGRISAFLASLAPNLIIEFVPKEDPMVRTLLATREDVFADYTIEGFRAAFSGEWQIVEEAPVTGTPRIVLRMVCVAD
jgi:ribosomal protein L11 methylase PrmA